MAGLGFNTVGFTPLSVGEQKINEFSVVVNFSNKFDSNYIPLNTVLNNINFSTEFDSNYVFELYTPLIVNFSTEFDLNYVPLNIISNNIINYNNVFNSNCTPLNIILNNIDFSNKFDLNYVFELYTPLIVNFSTEFYIDSKGGIVGMLLFRGRTISK